MEELNVGLGFKFINYFLKHKIPLKNFINSLEEERHKIGEFGLEIPLCMNLLKDVIDQLKLEEEQSDNMECVSQEYEEQDEHEDMQCENIVEEMDWSSSDQLWTTNCDSQSINFINNFHEIENDHQMIVEDHLMREEENNIQISWSGISPALSIPTIPAMTNTKYSRKQKSKRKAKQSWSLELHRRFVTTLQELDVATPKKIRKTMKVRGLKNLEVKNHLQKYKLHCRRLNNSRQFISSQRILQPA